MVDLTVDQDRLVADSGKPRDRRSESFGAEFGEGLRVFVVENGGVCENSACGNYSLAGPAMPPYLMKQSCSLILDKPSVITFGLFVHT